MLLRTKNALSACFWGILLSGCSEAPAPMAPAPKVSVSNAAAGTTSKEDAEIETALAELSEEDRALAKAQKFCVVSTEGRLGSMGTPVKLMIEDKPVFLCCKGCESIALKHPEETLAKVEKLKAANQ